MKKIDLRKDNWVCSTPLSPAMKRLAIFYLEGVGIPIHSVLKEEDEHFADSPYLLFYRGAVDGCEIIESDKHQLTWGDYPRFTFKELMKIVGKMKYGKQF